MRAIRGIGLLTQAALGSFVRVIARGVTYAGEVLAAIADAIDPPREWQPRLWDRDEDPRSDAEERRP